MGDFLRLVREREKEEKSCPSAFVCSVSKRMEKKRLTIERRNPELRD